MPSGLLVNPPTGAYATPKAQTLCQPPDVVTFHRVTRPSNSEDGLYAPALRFGDPRVMAVLASLVGFCHLVGGFSNRQLVQRTTALLDAPYATREATYDLRRLKRKGCFASSMMSSWRPMPRVRWSDVFTECNSRPASSIKVA